MSKSNLNYLTNVGQCVHGERASIRHPFSGKAPRRDALQRPHGPGILFREMSLDHNGTAQAPTTATPTVR